MGCCDHESEALQRLKARQSRVLKVILAVNAAMFVVELASGLVARSTALLGDSLDMFGDAAVYGLTLYVIDRGQRWRDGATLAKGTVMALLGVVVLVEAVLKVLSPAVPRVELMGGIGALALAANVACLLLLLRHRDDDMNMRSSWICSRNDIIANVSVIAAAAVVAATGSRWPDVAVGTGIAGLFLVSAVGVLPDATRSLRAPASEKPAPGCHAP